ncbi:MAG: hypothetical protein JST81_11530 [Bacteroidetes bacterium]|nr:hypothetical protein [Bacteroidota bacterium]
MKIEHLIAQYLYSNKKVTLQDIGVFYMADNVTIPSDPTKEAILPENAIRFEYNTKAVQDDGLIDFIVQQTRKIKPLATSDLESFTILGRQFMNIGKPLPIGGLGLLQKNQAGEYEFIQSHTASTKFEAAPATLKEKEEPEVVFSTPPRKGNSKTATIAAAIFFLILIASVAFYFVYKNNKDKKADQLLVQNNTPDSTPVQNNSSLLQKPDSTSKDTVAAVNPAVNQPVIVNGTIPVDFKVVIRQYENAAHANKIANTYRGYGYKVIQYPAKDSSGFKLAMEFKRPLTDTVKIIDSLKRIFTNSSPYIEKQ